ncbi:MAG TPA: zinc ribbon domain-containing protein [Blastocatellia bacterium]|nr:zinc ribbon domain-containing protein [Blastocatellia bacterium]
MYCANCGTQIQQGQNYCNRCGQAATAGPAPAPNPVSTPVPPPPVAPFSPAGAVSPILSGPVSGSRVACHLRTLGILWIVVSLFRLLPALGLLFFGHIGFPFMPSQMRFLMLPILGGIGTFLSLTAAAGILAGWGLLDRRPWARMLAIVLGCLALIAFPFGTALGIYTLWVLVPEGAEREYQRLARVS